MPMKLTRRTFTQGIAGIAAALLPLRTGALAETAGEAPEPIVLARATEVVLSAHETHVVLTPVPPPHRRPPPKARPKTKGEKPAPARMQLVFRDVVASKGGPAYDVFLVIEGPNVFQATSTRVPVGALEFVDEPAEGAKAVTVVLEANDALAKVTKLRGFTRNMRVAIVRRAVKNEEGKESVPPDPSPPQIGAIELVRA
jgi:hypothetical protein